MSRILAICLGTLIAAIPLSLQAGVYQCTVNGKITFSDIPCTGDAKPMDLRIYTPPAEVVAEASKQTQAIEKNLATSQKQRQLEVLRAEAEAKTLKMNNEITRYNEQLTGTTSSQADGAGEKRSAAEIQAMTRRHQSEMEALNKQISTLQQKK
ncbi:DUF4124 domain-containing protein [Aeromonas sp. MR16]|uniref:DUF4124 domain-containing protein n=1 Tax=Aeromonas sp. MR16 TaxID=2923420 RepID=UPI001F4A651F|nr:DUF4124 domain-containing protein [Aeromonas sp. MR16]MCH7372416.1 DUF4124 domain-containing protein [Aeromonas sp. MR16]